MEKTGAVYGRSCSFNTAEVGNAQVVHPLAIPELPCFGHRFIH